MATDPVFLQSFVCTFTKALSTPVLLRNYGHDKVFSTPEAENCTIWEAARATSAAATFFEPIQIGSQSYVDGATGLNNPIDEILREARRIWPRANSEIQCIVSIGTGFPDITNFGDNIKDIILTLKAIATEIEATANRFQDMVVGTGWMDRYYRFNVDHGLGRIGLEEHEKIAEIQMATFRYLELFSVQATMDKFFAAQAASLRT